MDYQLNDIFSKLRFIPSDRKFKLKNNNKMDNFVNL